MKIKIQSMKSFGMQLEQLITEKQIALSAYTKKESSTGLGLTITKELVELHGGKISLISEVNNGSTFIVEIPL